MIWSECILSKPVTAADTLGNQVPTGADTVVKTTVARESPFTAEEVSADARRLTRNQQRYILPVTYDSISEATFATIGGLKQKIVERQNLAPRWTVITVEAYKV